MFRVFSYFAAAICVVAAVTLIFSPNIISRADMIRENVMLFVEPSAERAFEYGEKHFNGSDVFSYDAVRAEAMFRRAEEIDPSFHYLQHELARIEFLKGNFDLAMQHINAQIMYEGDRTLNSYYIRGLIEGYAGRYGDAAKSYEQYLKYDPHNWAALNDYAWVLLKTGRAKDAAIATANGLYFFPKNPWLLNSNATALYELGFIDEARIVVRSAAEKAATVTEAQWIQAYPGNDPKIAHEGITALQRSIASNMFMITSAASSNRMQ